MNTSRGVQAGCLPAPPHCSLSTLHISSPFTAQACLPTLGEWNGFAALLFIVLIIIDGYINEINLHDLPVEIRNRPGHSTNGNL
jgi:hypothetical protein